jgi:hypothetical protein
MADPVDLSDSTSLGPLSGFGSLSQKLQRLVLLE